MRQTVIYVRGDVEHVLDGGSDEVTTGTRNTSTSENVTVFQTDQNKPNVERTKRDSRNVVHHDVHASQLRPHLKTGTQNDSSDDTRTEKVGIGLGSFSLFELNLFHDFVVLELDQLVVGVPIAVQVSEDLEGLVVSAIIDQLLGKRSVWGRRERESRIDEPNGGTRGTTTCRRRE